VSRPVAAFMVFFRGMAFPHSCGPVGRGGLYAALALLVFAGGCGGKAPPIAAVTGVVTRGGAPLAGATVVFSTVEPVADFGRVIATGRTGDDGRFTLVTRIDSRRSAAGGPVGENRVTVSVSVPPKGLTEAAYQAQLDAHQRKIEEKGYTAAGEAPPPRVSGLKPEFSDAARTPLTAKVVSGGATEFTCAVE